MFKVIFYVCCIVQFFGCFASADANFMDIAKCPTTSVYEAVNCAGLRFYKSLQKLSERKNINILPGISFVSENPSRQARELKDEPLSTNPKERMDKIMEMIHNTFNRFLSERSLKIQLSNATTESLARTFDEGRGKMKKVMNPWMMSAGASVVAMVPVIMTGVALLATKALVVGKLALVVSVILFVQYFFTGRNVIPGWGGFNVPTYGTGYTGFSGTYGTNNLGGYNPQYPYARSLDVKEEKDKNDDQLAYAGHVRK